MRGPIPLLGGLLGLVMLAAGFAPTGCGDRRGADNRTAADNATPPPVDPDAPPTFSDTRPIVLPPLRIATQGRFTTSLMCQPCHSAIDGVPGEIALRDNAGRSVAMYDLWRGTMMANAARDPFFRAQLSAELVATPAIAERIENKCLSCHAPMGAGDARDSNMLAERGMLERHNHMAMLGLDGVSCAVCHQIQPDNLGTPGSFNGGFEIGDDAVIFGPHENPVAGPMVGFSGFTPVYSDHMRDSALCATCHTLFTDAHAPDGSPTGHVMPEQTPYLEWLNSAFTTETPTPGPLAASCQACHVPTDDVDGEAIVTEIVRTPGGGLYPVVERTPVGRHIFVGGNTLIPAILGNHADELNPAAPPEAFNATIAAARDQLLNRTAELRIGQPQPTPGGGLEVPVTITNLCGHKFPTAYPSRRAWLRVRVTDADGRMVLESGNWDSRGRLTGPDGVLPSEHAGGPIQPHRSRVASSRDVVVYESIMADTDGAPTFVLMRAARFFKDSRILPTGWNPLHEHAATTRPIGVDGDADFGAGSDTVTIALPAATPRTGRAGWAGWRLQVDLVYQPLAPRVAAELFRYDTREVAAFYRYYQAADVRPEMVDSATLTIGGSGE